MMADPFSGALRSRSMGYAEHWNTVHAKREPEAQGWYARVLQPSMDWIRQAGLDAGDPIMDAGGGSGRLADGLLDGGFTNVTVLDLSGNALRRAQERLGERAAEVLWLKQDVLHPLDAPSPFACWHDRAVFHFLQEDADRARYREQVERWVRPSGVFIIGSFRLEGPDSCSGLPVRRHSAEELISWFAPGFEPEEVLEPVHITPGGVEQAYVFVRFRREQ